jgi:hypothetical protein
MDHQGHPPVDVFISAMPETAVPAAAALSLPRSRDES